jgi:hypothetical protein
MKNKIQQENYVPEVNNMDSIITTNQLMKVLSICRRSAQNLRDSGKLTFYKVGGKIYYRLSDINKMLDNHSIN